MIDKTSLSIDSLEKEIQKYKDKGVAIGFIPTHYVVTDDQSIPLVKLQTYEEYVKQCKAQGKLPCGEQVWRMKRG